jgi:hypothetical protein
MPQFGYQGQHHNVNLAILRTNHTHMPHHLVGHVEHHAVDAFVERGAAPQLDGIVAPQSGSKPSFHLEKRRAPTSHRGNISTRSCDA